MSYMLRVQLPDRPGSLGSLAAVLGTVHADILSLDVVERSGGLAVDDIVVDVPAGTLPDTLISAAERLPGVHVDSIFPYAGLLDRHRELELIAEVGASRDPLQTLADGLPAALRGSWAVVVTMGADAVPHRAAASPAAPETLVTHCDWMPLSRARVFDAGDGWMPRAWRELDVTVAAAPLTPAGTTVLLVGRTGGPEFRATEVARLGFIASILGRMLPAPAH